MSAKVNKKFKWVGEPCVCYHSSLKKANAEFYRSFTLNKLTYNADDFVVVSENGRSSKERVCRLLCVYESKEPLHKGREKRGLVCWYTWARKLEKSCNPMNIRFDMENEIIKDYRVIDVFINLEHILRKCSIIFGTEDDPYDIIPQSGLTSGLYYMCRFQVENELIEPVMTEENFLKENFDSYQKVEETLISLEEAVTPKRNKRKGILQETKNESNCGVSPAKSPKILDKRYQNENNYTPDTVKVKRNLHASFDESSDEEIVDVPNYSVVDKDISDDLKIKLRICNNEPNVSLEKLTEEVIDSYVKKDKTPNKNITLNEIETICIDSSEESDSLIRRSNRNTRRKSYADFYSPRSKKYLEEDTLPKNNARNSQTPRKVGRPPKHKVIEDIKAGYTPRKSILKTTPTPANTPKKSVNYKANLEETKFILSEEELLKTPKRSTRRVSYREDSFTEDNTSISYKRTPSARKNKPIFDDDDDYVPERNDFTTPTKNKNIKMPNSKSKKDDYSTPQKKSVSPNKSLKDTPSSRAKLIREGVLKPSMHSRKTPVAKVQTPLSNARTKLHVSYVPEVLPCREKEFSDIYHFLEGKMLDGCGGCMYISGVPGTGKTATITEVIRKLQNSTTIGKLPEFEYVMINGMRLTEPRQSYVEILRQLTGKTVPWEQAQNILESKFTKTSKKQSLPVILVVDELDMLCTKRQDVVYNLLDWPTKTSTQLVVVTIANTMDLPERLLMSRVTSRLGLTRLTFQAYTYKQLQEIVTQRLMGTGAFNVDAVQYVARKVASVSGDARRALDICRRAAEVAEKQGGPQTLVSMEHVNTALNDMMTQPKMMAIKHCSRIEKLILQTVAAEMDRTGVEETCFLDIYRMLESICALDGLKIMSLTLVLAAISRLGAYRLLITDQKAHEMQQKIILNVSPDDVHFALKKD